MDIVSLLDTLLTSVFKAEKDFFDNPKNFSNLEASVKSSTEAFAASFLPPPLESGGLFCYATHMFL